jgi:hypothetical protein
VLDLTHPVFAVSLDDAEYDRVAAEFVREQAQRPPLTPEMADALSRSRLGAALMAASGTFLSGNATYLLKLGADHLGPDASLIDRRIADSFAVVGLRVRLHDVAHLLAEALAPRLRAAPGAPLHLINIAGGPAADSWNALLLLQRDDPRLLAGRTIVITVLDLDAAGPAFGGRALAALRAPGGPLAGIDVELDHLAYRWSDVETLRRTLPALPLGDAVCAASSEGGLFDYGNDEEIVANLRALREALGPEGPVVATVTRDSPEARSIRRQGGAATHLRTLEGFTALAANAGFRPTRVIERFFSYHLALAPVEPDPRPAR